MKKPWIFTGNQFDSVTKTSKRKMYEIGGDTDSRLQNNIADPDILAIYNEYHPVFEAYRDIMEGYNSSTGSRKADTLNVTNLLDHDLHVQIALWEGKIRSVYAQGTPQEVNYFPNGRSPFLQGMYNERILAVRTLANKLADDPNASLAAYATTVMNFYTTLDNARDTQQMEEGEVTLKSSDREDQRKELAGALYIALARLMVKYHAEPSRIDDYFDLSLIRRKKKTIPANSIEVRGRVSAGAEAIVGAQVVFHIDGPEFKSVLTDSDGEFVMRIDHIPATDPDEGNLTMTIDVQGYQHYEQIVHVKKGTITTAVVKLAQGLMKAA